MNQEWGNMADPFSKYGSYNVQFGKLDTREFNVFQ